MNKYSAEFQISKNNGLIKVKTSINFNEIYISFFFSYKIKKKLLQTNLKQSKKAIIEKPLLNEMQKQKLFTSINCNYCF